VLILTTNTPHEAGAGFRAVYALSPNSGGGGHDGGSDVGGNEGARIEFAVGVGQSKGKAKEDASRAVIRMLHGARDDIFHKLSEL
jgi:hypothetical protein